MALWNRPCAPQVGLSQGTEPTGSPVPFITVQGSNTMERERLSGAKAAPEGYKAILAVEAYLRNCGLESRLLHLVKMRASQINGCAYCLSMHSRDARREGESEQRLYLLDAWREAPFYSPREQAALGWTDALTHISETHAPEDAYEPLRNHFTDKEIADLTLAVGMINLWNRLSIGVRKAPEVEVTG
jgi:AhpD family alkylhydroperoxidase